MRHIAAAGWLERGSRARNVAAALGLILSYVVMLRELAGREGTGGASSVRAGGPGKPGRSVGAGAGMAGRGSAGRGVVCGWG